jgi:HAMP domain-containing protein/signal transduction histidine kinase/DNA-binding response OmpR family regulator
LATKLRSSPVAALQAVASGDFSVRLSARRGDADEEYARAFNELVERIARVLKELERVSTVVGREGRIHQRMTIADAPGGWGSYVASVNTLVDDLTNPISEVSRVLGSVARGDLSQQMALEVDGRPLRGSFLQSAKTINTMVDRLNSFASEVTRVAREVGTDGKLGGQARVAGVSGTWRDLTDSVNSMAVNLTAQVRNIAEVTTAVARGDLSKKITVTARGEIVELKNTINTMVDQLNAFASEVTRVAREVGSEGRLGGQAQVPGVAGTWKDLTDNVNFMASNLTSQVRNIAEVTTAVAKGDLSKKITVDVRGELLELKNTINTMVDQLNAFASEVTRVAREVGSEGKLGGQAQVPGVAGTWKDLTDNVNSMAGNLTNQVRNIADVTTAVAKGDLSKKITVDVRGELLELKNTINTMVDQLNAFASEVTRVAREVGSDGKLGGQAEVRGVGGTWKDLTESVNSMAGNLTSQVRNVADVTTAVATGDLSKKITVDVRGEMLELKNTINTMVDQLNAFAFEVTRVAREVGTEGRLGGQAVVPGVAGTWKDLTDSVNSMAGNLTSQVRNIAKVTTAVANGDLSKKITVDVKGEILELKDTINTMVDQLNAFAGEVTRVAREVGSEGKLGGQAAVPGVAGTWKDLTDSVNSMAGNLTEQVRGIARVVTAVANGDLNRKLSLEAKGEIAALADTINGMIDTLGTFADQVTTVAREVGFDGRLGGQALVPGAAGLWKDLTDNVNQLAGQLTSQIRAIGEVATAVTKGDLSRTIDVGARGEVGLLTENVNEMIRNLRDTTQKNREQDWLKTNLARFGGMLQGQRDYATVAQMLVGELAPLVNAQVGAFYISEHGQGGPVLNFCAGYALGGGAHPSFHLGEGLVGQCALAKHRIVAQVPGDHLSFESATGSSRPSHVVAYPVLFEGDLRAVIELGSFEAFNDIHYSFLDQLTELIGIVLNTIAVSMRTEDLLKQSQLLTAELQTQQEELQQTNEQLEEKARLLSLQNVEVENRTRELEEARAVLELKAEQLALTSKYKSQFLANMSHELRTPLNSLLILSRQLADNRMGNLKNRQVEMAVTIQRSGTDLLTLINDILDLSKIESGTSSVDFAPVGMAMIVQDVEATFRGVAMERNLAFEVSLDGDVPDTFDTDYTRLMQILKNLLSNAFKFTAQGSVRLHVFHARRFTLEGRLAPFIAFAVSDSGIGIAPDKHNVIFEAFQQADMSTARKYGGTGLGLAISREIAGLLGGEMAVESEPDVGSTFTFFNPLERQPRSANDNGPLPFPAIAMRERRPQPRPLPALAPVLAGEDDRDGAAPRDRIVLIVEDDATFAGIIAELAKDRGFKTIVATTRTEALVLARQHIPHAITLDVGLPDGEGWDLLEELKRDPATQGIPVHVISGHEAADRALASGALAYLHKPVTEEALVAVFDRLLGEGAGGGMRRVLMIEDDVSQLGAMTSLIESGEVRVTAVSSAASALEKMHETVYHCIVLDLGLPDMEGMTLIERIRSDERHANVPIIVYTGRDLTDDQMRVLQRSSQSIIIKDELAPDRLIDETAHFLRRVATRLPDADSPTAIPTANGSLAGTAVMIVDDDARNIYALQTALEEFRITTVAAESGADALALLEDRKVDLVLMDIMMPEMDGYETIRRIRALPRWQSLPIIALTAKAMKGDRDACLSAGASDYVSKPVDVDQLLRLIRVWLSIPA